MISKIKKPVSILLSLIMVFSLFTIVPLSASAAFGDVLSEYDYLTFTAEEAGATVTLNVYSGSDFQYDLNGTGLNDYTPGTPITLEDAGDYVRFSGKDTTFNYSNHVSLTGTVACSGNVMSLRLICDMVHGLTYSCFDSMFLGCTGLTSAPELPETELEDSCYCRMFSGCTNLTKAPELPATNLAYGCYDSMFVGCTSLTELPALPATTLAAECYCNMFYGCSKICISDQAGTFGDITYSAAYRIPATGEGTSASDALSYMFAGTGGQFTGTPDINTTYYVPAPATATYTVTWKNWNGDVLETDDNVAAGTTPTYDGEVPTKAEDETNTYTFAGWRDGNTTYGLSDTLPAVSGDVTYTAQFTETAKPLPEVIKDCTYQKADSGNFANVPFMPDDASDYSSLLDGAINVAFDSGMIRLADAKEYSYKFYDQTGTEIAATLSNSSEVPGSEAGFSDNVTFYVKTFTLTLPENLDKLYIVATEPAPAPAMLILNVGENGKVVMDNGTFGNATDASNITEIPAPCNIINGSNATIVDGHTCNIVEGGSINIATGGRVSFYPSADNTGVITAIPDEGYICTGWYNGDTLYSSDAALSYQSISEDMTLTAKFAPAPTYTVTWKNWNGTELEKDENVAEGATPTYDGETPVRPEDMKATYTFAAWDDGTTTYVLGVDDLPPVTGDVTYTAVFTAEAKPLFVAHSVTLGGDIGVNFYLDSAVLDAYAGTKTVKFTCDGKETTVDVPATATADGYKVTRNVVAAQMAHTITATLYVNGEPVDTDEYSVREYAEKVFANPAAYDNKNKPEQLKALAAAMLHYGGEAQTVFASSLNEHPDRADSNLDDAADYSGVTAKAVAAKINGIASDLNEVATALDAEFYTSSLIYLQNNTLRLYFTPASKTVGALDGKGFSGNLSDYYYYVDHADIPAANLDDQQSFTVDDGTFNYSPLDYVKAVIESANMTEQQKNLAKALFLYNQAANAYFDAAPAPAENEVFSSGSIEDFSTLNVGDYIAKGVEYAADNDYKVVLTGGTYGTESRDGIVVRNGDYNFNAGEYGMGTYGTHYPQPNVFIEDYNENLKLYPVVDGVEGNAFVVVAKDDTQKIITIAGANVTQN